VCLPVCVYIIRCKKKVRRQACLATCCMHAYLQTVLCAYAEQCMTDRNE
jgi:hypothetical protein